MANAKPTMNRASISGRDRPRNALDENRPERPRDRRPVVRPQQIRAVHVAELRRHQAVDEPGQEQDLGRVAERDRGPGTRQDVPPPEAPKRERGVVREKGEGKERGVRVADEADHQPPVEVVPEEHPEQQEEQQRPEDERRDGSDVDDPSCQRDLARDRGVLGASRVGWRGV
jgi:hypothetical protein